MQLNSPSALSSLAQSGPVPRYPSSLLLLGMLLLAAVSGCNGQTAPVMDLIQGPSVPVPASYFGMHVHRLLNGTPWPSVGFTTLRLWDTGTTWTDLEPSRGQFRFAMLDGLVELAAKQHVSLILTFGKTPDWASSLPPGSTLARETGPPTSLDDWTTFVRTVATRYRGRIAGYEVWNEPNYHGFYTGPVREMVEMTRVASAVIHQSDPAALVLSPSPTSPDGLPWLREFLTLGGAQYVDVMAYHFYVTPDPPEQIVALAAQVRAALDAEHVDKPLWNTETGWGAPRHFTTDGEQAAFVARALLLGWVSGARRFYWYSWDNRNWATLNMTRGDTYVPTAAATAYDAIRLWMTGRRINQCVRDHAGTWSCRLTSPGEESFIYWNPERSAPYAPHSAIRATPKLFTPDHPLDPAGGAIPLAGPVPLRIRFRDDSMH